MANGDAAAAAGLTVFANTQDLRLGYDNDNIRGDELAAHLTAGTHPASAITSGTFNAARIPSLDASKITTGTLTRPISTTGTCTLGVSTITSIGSPASAFAIYSNGSAYFDAGITSPGVYSGGVSGVAVYVNSSGQIAKGISSKRYKKNITTAKQDTDAILAIRVVNYRMKNAPADSPLEIGVIAEELDELGLKQFVWYDEDGKPGAVHYERLALALIPVIQDHEERLNKLEGKN